MQGDRNSFDSCVEMLRVHPAYRDSADPVLDANCEWERRESWQQDKQALRWLEDRSMEHRRSGH